ncbi:CaiF/GrlA family transcriptional regulator, partial [Trabulsiella odontotermitis]
VPAGAPLWLAVASWGWQLGSAIGRDDVARAFRISARRAADVMTYLMNDRSDVVTIEKTIVHQGSGHRVAMYRIVAICQKEKARPAPLPCSTSARSSTPEERRRQEETMAQARHLFLHQRHLSPGA